MVFREVLHPDRIGIWKCWFLRRRESRSTWRKTSRSRVENQQQTQPTYDVESGNRTPGHIGGRQVLSPLRQPCSPSDHNLVVSNIQLRLSTVVRTQGAATARNFKLGKLKVPGIKQRFVVELKNRFGRLTEIEPDEMGNGNVEKKWDNIKKAHSETAKQGLKLALAQPVGRVEIIDY